MKVPCSLMVLTRWIIICINTLHIKLGFSNIINVIKHIVNTYYTGTLAGTRNSMIASHEIGFSFSSSVPEGVILHITQ